MIHFDEVKDKVIVFVKKTKEVDNEYYIVRDVYGKISIYIIGDTDIDKLYFELKDVISEAWIGQIRILEKDSVLLEEIISCSKEIESQIYYSERQLVKRSWRGVQCRSSDTNSKVVTFYSYKGGVGRTTTLALTALQMAREGKKVVALDLDLEAPGLSTVLKPENAKQYPQYGVVDYLVEGEVNQEHIKLDEYMYAVTDKSLLGMAGGELYVMQAANMIDSEYEKYYSKLSRIDFNMPKYMNENGPIQVLLKKLEKQYAPDYILIDSRAGIHDIGGLALLNYSDEVVALFYGNEQNMLGLKFVLPRLVAAELPFYLINTPVPVLEEATQEEVMCYLKNSYHILSECGYFGDEIPDIFDESSPHYPINIFYDVVSANPNTVTKLVQILNRDGEQNIYKQLAKLLFAESEVTTVSDSDWNKKSMLQAIKEISVSSADDEFLSYEELKQNFYPLVEYKYVFDNSKFIITGSKGSGKTALFKALKCQQYAQALAEYLDIPENVIQSTKWIVGLDKAIGFPTKANINAVGKTRDREYYSIYWKVLAIRVLKNIIEEIGLICSDDIKELINCKYSEISTIVSFKKNIDEQLSDYFMDIEQKLQEEQKTVIITYDYLDYYIDKEYRGEMISELLNFWWENHIRFRNLRTKIFLRKDILNNEVYLTDKVKLSNYQATIEWDYNHLLSMLWKRMMEANGDLRESVKRVLENKGYSIQESKVVGIVPKPSEEINKIILGELIGEKMGKGNKAYTYNWIMYRLGDTNQNIVPRSILKLFSIAAQNEIIEMENSNKDNYKLIRPRSLEKSMLEVSKDRVTDMREEYQEYACVFDDLQNYCKTFPVEEIDLRKALIQCGLKTENLNTEIAKLIEIGVLKEYQNKKSDPVRYHIPDIYLRGMSLTRKGFN